MNDIILLGANGYIAQAFQSELRASGLQYLALSRTVVDYTNFRNLCFLLKSQKPDVVINCAAFIHNGRADDCEDKRDQTLMGNLVFPTQLVNACEITATRLLHVSTGCLYNGDNGGKGFTEDDPPHLSYSGECGTYVGSKELAERVIREYPMAWICRVRLPFDEFDHSRNYISKLLRYPKIVRSTNSLSRRSDFVRACIHIWKTRAPYGTYNMTNRGAIDSLTIVEYIKHTLKVDKEFVFWNDQEFRCNVARTPKSNCLLNVDKLLATGFDMPWVEDAVFQSLKNWVPEKGL